MVIFFYLTTTVRHNLNIYGYLASNLIKYTVVLGLWLVNLPSLLSFIGMQKLQQNLKAWIGLQTFFHAERGEAPDKKSQATTGHGLVISN